MCEVYVSTDKQEQNEQRPATQIWKAVATRKTYKFRHILDVPSEGKVVRT